MEDQTKKVTLATAAIGGYVLGRTKKGRLALTVATVVAGRGLGSNARELATQGARRLGKMPQAAELKTHVREQGVQAARGALSAVANRGMGSLADAISGRTAALSQKGGAGDEEEEEEGEDEEEESRNEEDEDSEPENESESESEEGEEEEGGEEEEAPTAKRRRSARASGRSSERRGARTAPAKKAPAKKKVPAKKTAEKRTESSRSSRGR